MTTIGTANKVSGADFSGGFRDFLSVVPLPDGLSGGYDSVNTFIKSPIVARRNRASGQISDFSYVSGGPQDHVFFDNRMQVQTVSGYIETVALRSLYAAGGGTMFFVVRVPTSQQRDIVRTQSLSITGEARTGYSLGMTTTDFVLAFMNAEGTARTSRTITHGLSGGATVMVAASFDPTISTFGNVGVYMPHTAANHAANLTSQGDVVANDPSDPLSLMRHSFGALADPYSLSFVATRAAMTQAQIEADYALWKVWLAARGIAIL